MPNTCIILNPAAGSVKDADALMERLRSLPATTLKITSKRGSTSRFARAALKRGCDLIVAAGGDGTLNELINGIGEASGNARVGLIPLGTGNDFARTLGIPTDLDQCIELLLAGHTSAIDLVRVTSDRARYFVNVSAGGFSGLMNEKLTPELKKSWGPLAYLRCAAAALPELRAYRTQIALDDKETISESLYNVIIANGRYVAGGIPVAPEASPDDGLLDLVLIPERPVADLAILAPQMLMGNHLSSASIIFRRAARISVNSKPGMWFNVDGELVGNEPAVFQVLPGALQFVTAKS
ncbi:MAG TPA: diacylglycerol kinase family protein [Chthoniobacterales bacterium]|nr:diacylglycerol kinase family protein [Chthoniobacterales bacterium]